EQQSSFVADFTPGVLKFSAAVQYIGERFYSSDNSASVPPYAVTDVSTSARIDAGSLEFLPRIAVDDLFNRRYEVIYAYPMPGRTYRLGLSIQFNQGK
ncbi:MAG: TonB-dependent receptor, partial [Bacteroidota bacterium]|nr:TonB-dependent receptor [Bacteroidota bacterium]